MSARATPHRRSRGCSHRHAPAAHALPWMSLFATRLTREHTPVALAQRGWTLCCVGPSKVGRAPRPWFGATLAPDGGGVRLVQVFNGSPAERAGLAPGDVVVAVGGYRVDRATLDDWLARHADLETVSVHAFQRGRLVERVLPVEPSAPDTAVLGTLDEERMSVWLSPSVAAA